MANSLAAPTSPLLGAIERVVSLIDDDGPVVPLTDPGQRTHGQPACRIRLRHRCRFRRTAGRRAADANEVARSQSSTSSGRMRYTPRVPSRPACSRPDWVARRTVSVLIWQCAATSLREFFREGPCGPRRRHAAAGRVVARRCRRLRSGTRARLRLSAGHQVHRAASHLMTDSSRSSGPRDGLRRRSGLDAGWRPLAGVRGGDFLGHELAGPEDRYRPSGRCQPSRAGSCWRNRR